MTTSTSRLCAPFVSIALIASAGLLAQTQAPAPSPPQFRTGVTLVPLDVRVVDRQGRPVTDLKESEFTILENGRQQAIRHFSTVDLRVAGEPQALISPSSDPALPTPTRRIFLFVLGRGRLQHPGRGADAVIEFVKSHVQPQDYVAVLAWNRATSFSTDHAKTLGVLEKFRSDHEAVERAMADHFSGLAALYAGPEIPAHVQRRIDAVFAAPGLTLPTPESTIAPASARETRTIRDGMLTQEIRALFPDSKMITPVGEDSASLANRLGMEISFDEFITLDRQSAQDMANLYAGISYLRHLTGEKHLVFVTERGVFLPSADDDRNFGAQAADARVAVTLLHTSGAPPGWMGSTSRSIAAMTGGTYTSTMRGPQFLDRLGQATRFQYLLGYTPENTEIDGKFRRVEVRVSRPGTQVLSRQGYFARRAPPPLDARTIVAQSRVASAAMSQRPVRDLTVNVTATSPKGVRGASHVDLTITVAHGRVHLAPQPGGTLTRVVLEVAMFCGNTRNQIVGQSWRTVTVDLQPDALERFKQHGMKLTGRVEITGAARDVKVVVYDPAADLLGAATARVR